LYNRHLTINDRTGSSTKGTRDSNSEDSLTKRVGLLDFPFDPITPTSSIANKANEHGCAVNFSCYSTSNIRTLFAPNRLTNTGVVYVKFKPRILRHLHQPSEMLCILNVETDKDTTTPRMPFRLPLARIDKLSHGVEATVPQEIAQQRIRSRVQSDPVLALDRRHQRIRSFNANHVDNPRKRPRSRDRDRHSSSVPAPAVDAGTRLLPRAE